MNKNTFVTAGELAKYLHCPILGNREQKIYGISLCHESKEDMLTYVPFDKIDEIKNMNAGVILTRPSLGLPLHRNYIITNQEPYFMLADTISFLCQKGIYRTKCSESPKISANVNMSEFVSIGNGSSIAEYTKLSPGVVIGDNVRIGANCSIGANTVIGDNTIIEDNVQIGSCCSIGNENFESCKNEHGWIKIPAIGHVHIHDNVYICSNVVIEKGTIGTTEIGAYTQIDNLVQIGHEAKIGTHCHIVACVAIAGWAEIGNHVDIYGQAAISNHVHVGDHSILLARAGVDKMVESNSIVSGFPAQDHYKELKFHAFLRRLFRSK